MRQRVLLVDDRPDEIKDILQQLRGRFELVVANTTTDARSLISTAVDAVILDVRLDADNAENREGLSLLAEIRRDFPFIPVVMLSGLGAVSAAVEAMKTGAVDFLDKSTVSTQEVVRAVRRAISQARLRRTVDELQRDLDLTAGYRDIVGTDPQMEAVRRLVQLVADDGDTTVLIRGETGTGKELVARAIHRTGRRADGPFVGVSLAALNRDTVSSELFGYERGAFTGAGERRVGYIEQANGGVLFLDEIGEISEELQVKLLRFLDEHTISRLGATRGLHMDLQLVTATNAALADLVSAGRVRQDLYYRLNGFVIELPPLRSRRQDIPLLASLFLARLHSAGRTPAQEFSDAALTALMRHQWPGNVRELRNVVENSALRAKLRDAPTVDETMLPSELQPATRANAPIMTEGAVPIDEALARFELDRIYQTLREASGSREQARVALGYANRSTMWRRIRAHFRRFPHLAAAYGELEQGDDANPHARSR